MCEMEIDAGRSEAHFSLEDRVGETMASPVVGVAWKEWRRMHIEQFLLNVGMLHDRVYGS
jgi:hypothetical protein